jgi:hAT family C-terminal dimerisation region
MLPVFVALQPNVAIMQDQLRQESLERDAAGVPHLSVAKGEEERPKKISKVEQLQASSSSHPLHPVLDMDGDEKEEKKEEKEDHDIEWEIRQWLSHDAPFLPWYDDASQPSVTWMQLQSTFPRLSLLARRFLCILPSSAPSERIWSDFAHVVSKASNTIDSLNAAQLMFLRHNKDMLDQISPFHPSA